MKARKLVPLVALVLAFGILPASAKTRKTNGTRSSQSNPIASLFSKISSGIGSKRINRKSGSTSGTTKRRRH